MKIAICEDNAAEQNSIAACVGAALEEQRVTGNITRFSSGEELLDAIQDTGFSIYFLDIYLDHVSGVQAAYAIKEKDPDAVIVFITSSTDHMGEGFDVGAVHYIVKPVTEAAVRQALSRALRLTREQERYVTVIVDRVTRKIMLADILAVESKDKSCIITTRTGTLQSYVRLNTLENMLDDKRFLRCHRSFLINMDHTSGVSGSDFQLADGTLIPIKRDRRLAMKQQFQDYCFEKLREGMK